MQLHFDTDIARLYSIEEAVFVHNIFFWVKINQANQSEMHFHEGRYWTYHTLKGLAEYFENIWSTRQIARLVEKCRKNGLIDTAFFNENKRDRTMWYTVTETVNCIYRNRQMAIPESVNGDTEIGKCIKGADRNTDSATNSTNSATNSTDSTNSATNAGGAFREYAGENTELLAALAAFETMRKSKRKPLTDRARKMLLNQLDKLSGGDPQKAIQLLEQSVLHAWDTVYRLDNEGFGRSGGLGSPEIGTGGRTWL